jgi:cytochrome c oxidase assembly protein subunit 15
MSGVVAVVALLTFLFLIRLRKSRPELFWLSFTLGLLVLVQAGIGGIAVLTHLETYIVGLHFVLSAIMVILATALVWHILLTGQRHPAMPLWLRALAWTIAALSAVTVVVGILTTGSGPHAGDIDSPRNGLPTELLEHLHAWPAYALLATTIVIVLMTGRAGITASRNLALWLLGAELVQIAVGLYQARNGLPPLSVGTHMVLSCILLAIATALFLSTTTSRRP